MNEQLTMEDVTQKSFDVSYPYLRLIKRCDWPMLIEPEPKNHQRLLAPSVLQRALVLKENGVDDLHLGSETLKKPMSRSVNSSRFLQRSTKQEPGVPESRDLLMPRGWDRRIGNAGTIRVI